MTFAAFSCLAQIITIPKVCHFDICQPCFEDLPSFGLKGARCPGSELFSMQIPTDNDVRWTFMQSRDISWRPESLI